MASKHEQAMLGVALVGILLALYAIPLHYSSGGSICDINDTLNCDVVNKSQWSTLFGIPVAVLGFLSYLAVFFAVLFRKRIQRMLEFTENDFAQYLLFLTAVMFLFQLYLTFAEVFFIGAYCIVCLVSQVAVFLLFLLAFLYYRRKQV